jgi:hypothetical protein
LDIFKRKIGQKSEKSDFWMGKIYDDAIAADSDASTDLGSLDDTLVSNHCVTLDFDSCEFQRAILG